MSRQKELEKEKKDGLVLSDLEGEKYWKNDRAPHDNNQCLAPC